jgi:hypothetical protein
METTTDPTPLADLLDAIDATGEVAVFLSPVCAASFDGGPFTFTRETVEHFTFTEDDDVLLATGDWHGRPDREFVVEM